MSATELVRGLKEQLEHAEGFRKEAELFTTKYHKLEDELLVKF